MIRTTVVACLPVALGILDATGTVYAPASASREERFANPPACARILPLRHGWSYNAGKVDAELRTLKDEGFGGFAGNVNWTTNYLQDAASWKVFRQTVEKARAQGMTLWLYDEKGYPSSTAGGQTLEGHPELQMRAFFVSVTNDMDGALRVVGVRTDRVHEGTQVAVRGGSYKYPYPNLLMRESTERFIDLTHNAYRRELGSALRCFDSTFTDEPSLMTYWMKPMSELCLPVSDELLAAYKAKFGHPLGDDVPALVTGEPVGKTAEIRHRYWSMIAERFAKNYIGRLADWTSANGILSGGHLLSEESLVAHVPLYGDFFRALRGFTAPGCDVLTSIPEKVNPVTPLFAGSAGELNGALRVMSEASDHIQRYRAPGDKRPPVQVTARQIVGSLNRQIWGGVNTFTSYYRWDAFSVSERREINEEIGRTITLVAEGRSAAEVAVLYPADALMTGFEPQKVGAGGELAQRVAESFGKAVQALFRKGRPLLIVDAESLAQADVKDGALVRGPLAWRTVVLPSAVTLPLGAARKLAALQAAGGQVIALGERPINSERAFPDGEIASLAANWTLLPSGLVGYLPEVIASRHQFPFAVTRGAADILRVAHRRTAKDGDVLFVANDSPEPWAGAVRVAGDPEVRVWNPRIGLFHRAAGEIPLELPPYAAVVLTTSVALRGRMTPGAGAAYRLEPRPLAVSPTEPPSVVKGTYVMANVRMLPDGFARAETELTKGNVDTFAFVSTAYGRSPFAPDAKGLAFTVRVPAANLGNARLGVSLEMKDKSSYFASTGVALKKIGTHEVVCAFADFSRLGAAAHGRAEAFRPEDVRRINIGYAGYYGLAGEKVVFDVSAPKACVLMTSGRNEANQTGCPEFAVECPRKRGGPVLRAADFGFSATNDDNAAAINRALLACARTGASRLELSRGTFLNPKGAVWHVASGTNLVFRNNRVVCSRRSPHDPPYRGKVLCPVKGAMTEAGNSFEIEKEMKL